MKGLGSAYGASAFPPNIHPFLNASNLSGSLNSSTWVYTPNALGTTPTSLALELYDRGEKLPVSGAFCDFSFKSEGAGITLASFKVSGIPGAYSDQASPPARTWIAANVIPPKNEAVTFSIGSYTTPIVKSYTFEMGQTITPRMNLNTSGSMSGFALGGRSPKFTVVVEAEQLGTFNAYTDLKNATLRALSLTVGAAGTNNAFTFSMPSASLADVKKSNDGPIATWELTYVPALSAPDTNDDFSLTFIA